MSKISLIIQREYNARVRKRSFILTTLLTPLLFVALMVVPMLMTIYGGSEKRTVIVVDRSGVMADSLTSTDLVTFQSPMGAEYPDVAEEFKTVFGYLVIPQDIVTNPEGMKLYTRESSTMDVERDIKRQISALVEKKRIASSNIPDLDSLIQSMQVSVGMQTFRLDEQSGGEAKASSSALSAGVAYAGGFLIYMFIFMYGVMVMQGVIEEKSNRIMEVMISSVRPFELMMGKIVGIALVALTQVLIWIVLCVAGMLIFQAIVPMGAAAGAATNMGMGGVMGALSDPMYLVMVVGGFVVFFVGGYLLYAAMFAAIGSAVDNVGDTQQLQMPITIPLILALVVMLNVMQEPNSSMAFWFSIIPFTSPIIMIARIAYGVPLWEFALSVVLLYGSFIVITWFAAKIYRIGVFMYGKKPSFAEIIKWTRYKY